ncbi:F-box only protein 16 isoform X4 [Stigmatopora nigra]
MNNKMPQAPKSPASPAKLQTRMSAWTPLNHSLSNSKVFEERRSLLAKWFDRWSDRQRKLVLHDFVKRCSKEQLRHVDVCVSRQLPLQAADFTCQLPRAICLYIFSFLDPRSLCRCARVSWHWKSMVELDQLWMPKCLRLGWFMSFSPSVFEQGVWKRHYVITVQEMLLTASSVKQQIPLPDVARVSNGQVDVSLGVSINEGLGGVSRSKLKRDKHLPAHPPWRDSDKHPKDIIRFNYLDNLDPVHMKSQSITFNKKEKPDEMGQKMLSETSYKLRKVKSLMFLTSNNSHQHSISPPSLHETPQLRPRWASQIRSYPATKEEGEILLRQGQWNAGKRPGPVRTAIPRLSMEALRASQRSNRSIPSVPLFEFQPWTLPLSLTQYED